MFARRRGRTPACVLSIALIAFGACALGASAQKAENKTYLTPPYFNLAEGRKVYASATCGEDTEGPELYCKLVGPTNSENDVNVNVIHGQVNIIKFLISKNFPAENLSADFVNVKIYFASY